MPIYIKGFSIRAAKTACRPINFFFANKQQNIRIFGGSSIDQWAAPPARTFASIGVSGFLYASMISSAYSSSTLVHSNL